MAKRYVLGENAARGLARLLHGTGGVSRRDGISSELATDSDFADPFAVKWAASADDGDGAWVIWLPDEKILSVAGVAVDPSEDLDDAGGDYPEGWYILVDTALSRSGGGTLYLNVATDGVSCEFASSPSSTGDIPIAICTASVDSTTGARQVEQFVASSIVLSSAFSGCYAIDDIALAGSGTSLSVSFANPYYRCGGKTYVGADEMSSVALPAIVALKVSINGNTPSAALVSYASLSALQMAELDVDYYILPLYKFNSSGGVECDMRTAPSAAMFEFANQA